MITKGFQVKFESDDYEDENSKVGLASNAGIYGESIISFAKREVSFHIDDEEEED